MEPRVLSLCWIPKGRLQSRPDRVFTEENEIEELAKAAEKEEFEEISNPGSEPEDESENESEENKENGQSIEKIKTEKAADRPEMDPEEEKIWDEYNMDDYDDEPDDIAVNIGSLVVPQNENEYHNLDLENVEDEDDEDITLTENDHVLLAGIDSPDGTANIEVRIFNLSDEFYVRNDISLESPPLCLCYINQEIGTETEEIKNIKKEDSDANVEDTFKHGNGSKDVKNEYSQNFVAVGCLKGAIQIWDLDVLDAPGPAYTLIGHDRSSMVISLSWDGNKSLASGGADGKCLIWSLENGSKTGLGKETNQSPQNQVLFLKNSEMLATGDGNGIFNIYKNNSNDWICLKQLDLGFEIEKIATCDRNLVAIGTAKGTITLLKLDTFEVIAKWTAHKNQPITGLEFNSSELLFSSGHVAGTNLILWNLHLHQTAGSEKKIPLQKYARKRQIASGKLFASCICPEAGSELVLTGGEVGGAQVMKLSRVSTKTTEDDGDTDEEEAEDDEGAMDEIKEEEWETDSGSSEGEEMEDAKMEQD